MDRTERQKLGIRKWVDYKCRGTLCWSTGVGKTNAACIAIKLFLTKNKGKKIVVVVPTDNLKVQWISVLVKQQLFYDVSVEIINSAIKRQEKVDLLILDEIHTMGGDSFIEIFKIKNPTLVLGLSATFNRLDGRHELLAKHAPICDTIGVKEAIENNWLSSYKEYKVSLEPDDIQIYRELNSTFLSTFSFFNNDFKLAMECVGGRKIKGRIVVPSHIIRYEYAKYLCQLSEHDPRYSQMVKSLNAEVAANAFTWNRSLQARKEYVMNHPLKILVTQKILQHRLNSKAITFSATIKQAEKIGVGYTVHSGQTKKKNRCTLEEFNKLKTGVLNTSKSCDSGTDIAGLNLAVVLCNTSSATSKTQRVGRVIRYEEGKEAEVFTLVIKGTVEENWFKTSNAGKSYIEISESELDEILSGKVSTNKIEEGEEMDLLFRL